MANPIDIKVEGTKVVGVVCFAYFRGGDGLGTCDTRCQWWRDSYLKGEGCVMWVKETPIASGEKGFMCFLDHEPCIPDEEGFSRCGDEVATCLWLERRELQDDAP